MTVDRETLAAAWTSFFQEDQSYFVSLTFNLRGLANMPTAKTRIRGFSRELDQRRLGQRFYERPASERILFMLIPEMQDCAMLHFHGALRLPDDRRAIRTPADYPTYIAQCWRNVVPSGTCDVQPLRDAGALLYATKETFLSSDDVICSFDLWSTKTL